MEANFNGDATAIIGFNNTGGLVGGDSYDGESVDPTLADTAALFTMISPYGSSNGQCRAISDESPTIMGIIENYMNNVLNGSPITQNPTVIANANGSVRLQVDLLVPFLQNLNTSLWRPADNSAQLFGGAGSALAEEWKDAANSPTSELAEAIGEAAVISLNDSKGAIQIFVLLSQLNQTNEYSPLFILTVLDCDGSSKVFDKEYPEELASRFEEFISKGTFSRSQ